MVNEQRERETQKKEETNDTREQENEEREMTNSSRELANDEREWKTRIEKRQMIREKAQRIIMN